MILWKKIMIFQKAGILKPKKMGWYLHEAFSQFIELPTTYSLAVCATCWIKKTNKLTDEELEKEPRIFDIIHYAKKSKYFVTQEKFEKEHKGHVLAYVKIDKRWCEWKPQVYCKDHETWTEIYTYTRYTENESPSYLGSVSTLLPFTRLLPFCL